MGKGKSHCSCGFPQSFPLPHEHDRTEREEEIIKYFQKLLTQQDGYVSGDFKDKEQARQYAKDIAERLNETRS